MFTSRDVLEAIGGLDNTHHAAIGAYVDVRVDYLTCRAFVELTDPDGKKQRFVVMVEEK